MHFLHRGTRALVLNTSPPILPLFKEIDDRISTMDVGTFKKQKCCDQAYRRVTFAPFTCATGECDPGWGSYNTV